MLQNYSFRQFPFMRPQGPHMPVTESYVVCPPALVIRTPPSGVFGKPSPDGCDLWTLGFDQGGWRTGEFEYDVVCNGVKTGEKACRIEYRRGKLRIFGEDRWRPWTGKTFI